MGNKTSLSISLDSEGVHQAGQNVEGKVHLVVERPHRGGGTVYLKIVGKEIVRVQVGIGKDKRIVRSERSLLNGNLPLRTFQGTIAQGAYALPFVVPLPDSLPSSMSYYESASGSGKGCCIQYSLVAEIGRKQVQRFVWVTSASLPNEVAPCTINPKSMPIREAKLFNRGTLLLGARVENTNLGRTSVVQLHLSCRNDSTADIRRVEIRGVEQIVWSRGLDAGGNSIETTLFHMKDVDLPGIAKERKESGHIQADLSSIFREMYADLSSGQNRISCRIPANARDSYSGNLIQVKHYLEIKLQTRMLVSNPATYAPLRIGNLSQRAPVAQPGMTNAIPRPVAPGVSTSTAQSAVFVSAPQAPTAQAAVVPESQSTIPLVQAIVADAGPTVAPKFVASADVIVLGGDAIISANMDDDKLTPLAPPLETVNAAMSEPSLQELLRQMTASVRDYDIISAKTTDAKWLRVFRSLSPDDYGTVVAHVAVEFDQPRVASLLAPYVGDNDRLTCVYAAAAVRKCAEWIRTNMVTQLLPLCVDIASHYNLIKAELNEWEQTITQNDFEAAIKSNMARP